MDVDTTNNLTALTNGKQASPPLSTAAPSFACAEQGGERDPWGHLPASTPTTRPSEALLARVLHDAQQHLPRVQATSATQAAHRYNRQAFSVNACFHGLRGWWSAVMCAGCAIAMGFFVTFLPASNVVMDSVLVNQAASTPFATLSTTESWLLQSL